MNIKLGIANRGNWYRLKEKIKKAKEGNDIVIGFLGGSITQGSLSSSIENCYAYLVYNWWKNRFPNSRTHFINAGIGGTSSLYGAARVNRDLLVFKPDVVFVDFSVNDEGNKFFEETFEGTIRQIYYADTKPAIIILNNVFYDTGKNAELFHNKIGTYYELPCVSMKNSIYQHILNGIYTREDISPDGLHPNDKGHHLIAEELSKLLNQVYEDDEIIKDSVFKKAYTKNAYEKLECLQAENCAPTLQGFAADTREKAGMLDLFKGGWIGNKVGDKICFDVEGDCIAVQYRKSVKKPVPVAKVTLDGDEKNAAILDGNFDEDWGDCLYLESILHHGDYKSHHIQIEIVKAAEHDAEPFYLVSILVARR